jgi:hypothetical protein
VNRRVLAAKPELVWRAFRPASRRRQAVRRESGDDLRPPIAGLAESVQPRTERPTSLVLIARRARQRLPLRQRASLGAGVDMVARRCSHRLAAIGARFADGRDELRAENFAHRVSRLAPSAVRPGASR